MRSRLMSGLVLVAFAFVPAAVAFASPQKPASAPATAPAVTTAAPATPAWIATSNAFTRKVLDAQAKFSPEDAAGSGLSEYDGLVTDMGPKIDERYTAAMRALRAGLQASMTAEKDPLVKQDLQILIGSIDNDITGIELNAKYNLPWIDVPRMVFGSVQQVLQSQLPAAREAKAVELLQRYVGLTPGSTPMVDLARARYAEKLGNKALSGPVRARLQRSLDDLPTFIKGIRELFAKAKLEGAGPALDAMEKQFTAYGAWERAEVLPRARDDFRLPPELYAFRLKQRGIDIAPALLIQRAQVEFMETRYAMQALAPVIATARGWKDTDYRSVLRAMKKQTIANDKLEATYAEVNSKLEAAIQREAVVDLPKRPMLMRLASEAESAAQPAPHMQPPPMIGNTGEQGQFVLPVGNPGADGKGDSYDDFNFSGATWTLSAHEGRPGHELQFSAMIERGVSQARALYAFNSVNVEGWALYAEAEMVPYEPAEGQMVALQFRMLRAARAMLDPMLNLGMISREDAGRVLSNDVMLSEAMTRQELDRYTFNSPGQAGSYFYGYSRILQMRAATEIAMGSRFNRLAFNNFLLDQGMLPPDLLEAAVRENFIPAGKAAASGK
ncbi:DUF885 domain-containing protein [soil metagenome]